MRPSQQQQPKKAGATPSQAHRFCPSSAMAPPGGVGAGGGVMATGGAPGQQATPASAAPGAPMRGASPLGVPAGVGVGVGVVGGGPRHMPQRSDGAPASFMGAAGGGGVNPLLAAAAASGRGGGSAPLMQYHQPHLSAAAAAAGGGGGAAPALMQYHQPHVSSGMMRRTAPIVGVEPTPTPQQQHQQQHQQQPRTMASGGALMVPVSRMSAPAPQTVGRMAASAPQTVGRMAASAPQPLGRSSAPAPQPAGRLSAAVAAAPAPQPPSRHSAPAPQTAGRHLAPAPQPPAPHGAPAPASASDLEADRDAKGRSMSSPTLRLKKSASGASSGASSNGVPVAAAAAAAAAEGTAPASSARPTPQGRVGGRGGPGSHPARVQFCPGLRDVYGAVNCLPHNCGGPNSSESSAEISQPPPQQSSPVSASPGRMKKLGPVLLELRRLSVEHDPAKRAAGMCLSARTVAVSRGNPALGAGVASTCLDFRPVDPEVVARAAAAAMEVREDGGRAGYDGATMAGLGGRGGVPDTVRCATGLTSGALCVHTISDLAAALSSSNSNGDAAADAAADDDGGNGAAAAAQPLSSQLASSSVTYYAPRSHRPATSVSWRPGPGSSELRHVAVGLVGSGGGDRGGTTHAGGAYHHHRGHRSASAGGAGGGLGGGGVGDRGPVGVGALGMGGLIGAGAMASAGGDREFGCLVWDVEAQSGGGGGGGTTTGTGGLSVKAPAYRFAHNSGVASLSWLSDGQLLAVGTQHRSLQLYDLRVSGTNAPPVSVYAHSSDAVSGIEPDPHRTHIFATFSRGVGEPVKLWDARRMDGCLSEIKTAGPLQPSSSMAPGGASSASGKDDAASAASGSTAPAGNFPSSAVVSAVAWSAAYPGTLSVAVGDTVRSFDCSGTASSRSRPVLTRVRRCPAPVQCVVIQPPGETSVEGDYVKVRGSTREPIDSAAGRTADELLARPNSDRASELYPHRMLVVEADGGVRDLAKFQVVPIAISRRDGRIVHALGTTVWMGSTTNGPSAIEKFNWSPLEDVSATMMRRARCFHAVRYSTDASSNLRVLEGEHSEKDVNDSSDDLHFGNETEDDSVGGADPSSNHDALWRLWDWIERVDALSSERDDSAGAVIDELPLWPAKGLLDAGVMRLLRMDYGRSENENDYHLFDVMQMSDSLKCNVFDSPMRRAALSACGWMGKFGLRDVLADCEEQGNFERSAALAVWHGDLGAAVAALQRGADSIRLHLSEEKDADHAPPQPPQWSTSLNVRYAETLQLVAMCVAGYSGNNPDSSSSGVWRNACEGLLRRDDVSLESGRSRGSGRSPHISYLRAVCTFLLNIGRADGLDKTLYDESLSLSDRVAVACCYLERKDLKAFLETSVDRCERTGNLEGLLITGIDRRGISLLQSYVDAYSDVQTAALVSSRVVLPSEWVSERIVCSEWLDSHRDLLNTWQMWQSRAMFDVGRAEILRRIKGRHDELALSSSGRGSSQHQGRRSQYGFGIAQGRKQSLSSSAAKQSDQDMPITNFPAQLYARCNYCNTSLPLSRLRRQEGMANTWLSRQKPVLSCCPQCKKPLPRCAICLLPLGCLNPYMELKRERNRVSRGGLQDIGDLSELSNLPFAEWFTWCMRCKHGGHAHHLVGWFASHETCAVSGCDCRCQFDGIQKLSRPALHDKKDG